MLVSLNLLKKYVDLPLSVKPEEVVAKLATSTVEVEEFFEVGKDLEDVVVGKVVKLEKHPNADKLKIAMVDIGQVEPARIVCGGINLYEGMLVAVAKPGAMIRWHGEGELVTLEKAKIRGEESEGMICASNEIGLSDRFPGGELEIIDLTALDFKVGAPLAKELSLDDVIIDIDNKSITNRPDLWGHYGIARELSAIYGVELKSLEVEEKVGIEEAKAKGSNIKVSVKESNLCPRYLAVAVEGIKVKESPLWLKNVLSSIGFRPINNIVDITNYVMAETGQPLHAFDRSRVDNIVVRLANKGEKMVALDKEERALFTDTLVIADSKKPIAIAGVMGGANSQISETTKEIIIESANFNPLSIRKTSQKIGLRTDASMRFEKSLDGHLTETALRRALELIKEILSEAKVVGPIVEDGGVGEESKIVEVSPEKVSLKIGETLSVEAVSKILVRLGFEVKEKKDKLMVTVPSWRATGDVAIEEDIVEEVARIYGYDQIKPSMPEVKMKPWILDRERAVIDKTKDILSLGLGMQEVLNYSFWSEKLVADSGIDKEGELLALQNPLSEEQAYLRMSLLPAILKNISDNSRFYSELKIYEIGRVFRNRKGKYKIDKNSKDRLPDQPYYLAGAVVFGRDKQPFQSIKGILEEWGKFSGIDFLAWSAGKNPFCEFTNQIVDKEKRLAIIIGKEKIGWVGEVNQKALEYFDIKNRRVAVFELDLTPVLESGYKEIKKYQPVIKYPAVERDIAIEVAWKTRWESIKKEIEKLDTLIVGTEFLSEYDLGKKKSLAFRVVYRASDHTLSDKEVEKIEGGIIKFLGDKFGAARR
ncbi:phenylalanine--tRNA ligase subunit beta [Candidatus Kuenenbacteria bacterium]|nr:phenylalanine--tRNA ligase subunit beta [Candidatus Kuenenbacteria bacterium]